MKIRSAIGSSGSFEKVAIAILMTWTAGFIDLVGFVSLYGLYVSHMSGNTVAMARHISQLDWIGFVRHAWPIATFIFGLILGAFIYDAEKRRHIKVPFPTTIGLEALLVTAFIAAGAGNGFKAVIPPQPALKFFVMVALLTISDGDAERVDSKGGRHQCLHHLRDRVAGQVRRIGFGIPLLDSRSDASSLSQPDREGAAGPRRDFEVALQHAALTIGLYLTYLTGAVCGGFSIDRWELRGMFAPLIVLVAIAAFGAFRPYIEQSQVEW